MYGWKRAKAPQLHVENTRVKVDSGNILQTGTFLVCRGVSEAPPDSTHQASLLLSGQGRNLGHIPEWPHIQCVSTRHQCRQCYQHQWRLHCRPAGSS